MQDGNRLGRILVPSSLLRSLDLLPQGPRRRPASFAQKPLILPQAVRAVSIWQLLPSHPGPGREWLLGLQALGRQGAAPCD
jgi:hypothetical protein